jgi:hypothetical protein
VGSGSKIQIWGDPWINHAPSKKVSLKRGRTWLRWVSQLLIEGRREWDVQLLNSILYRHDVEEILKIKLFDRVQEDHMA